MNNLGSTLREAREAKDISYQQVDQDLKIKQPFIEALENEAFDVFPSIPMLRGFIRNYSTYLGLDAHEMLALHDEHLNSSSKLSLKRYKGRNTINIPMGGRRRSIFNVDTFITMLLVVGLVGSAGFFTYTQYLVPAEAQILTGSVSELEPVAFQEEAALALPTPTSPPTDTPTPALTPTPQYYTGVAVELVITERSWVQILVDDVKAFDGFLEIGEQRRWDGDQRVAIRAGNAGGVQVYVNGQDMGIMGEPAQVVDQVWEKVDDLSAVEITATPTPQP